MGHKNSKNKQEETIEDMALQMKLTAKQFSHSAKRARKDQQKEINKAKIV